MPIAAVRRMARRLTPPDCRAFMLASSRPGRVHATGLAPGAGRHVGDQDVRRPLGRSLLDAVDDVVDALDDLASLLRGQRAFRDIHLRYRHTELLSNERRYGPLYDRSACGTAQWLKSPFLCPSVRASPRDRRSERGAGGHAIERHGVLLRGAA